MKTLRYNCDGPDCLQTANDDLPKTWHCAEVTYDTVRERERNKKELHYCDKCWERFRKFMKGEA